MKKGHFLLTCTILLLCKTIFPIKAGNEYLNYENVAITNIATTDQPKLKEEQKKMQNFLDSVSASILILSKNEYFKNVLYQEIVKRFDGENNVLIRDIYYKCKADGLDILPDMSYCLRLNGIEAIRADRELSKALNGYKTNNGVILYPHIYIPALNDEEKFNEIKKNGNVYIVSDRIIEDEKSTFKGRFIKEDLTISQTAFEINEQFAINNEVWVVAFNERVDETGKNADRFNKTSLKGEDFLSIQSTLGRDLKILEITCPDLNALEGWTRGGPELYLKVFCCLQGEFVSGYFTGKRSQFQFPSWFYANKLLRYWDYIVHGENLYFFWYEGDGLYDSKNTYVFNFGCNGNISSYTVQTNYQDEYAGGRVVNKNENLVFQTDLDLVRWKLLW
jgi:hypothetical protein